MSNFKPQITYTTRASLDAHYNASPYAKPVPRKSITTSFNSYRELLKCIKESCETNIDLDGVQVIRSKRGQWGEWFENWKLDNNNKPVIIKEGWM